MERLSIVTLMVIITSCCYSMCYCCSCINPPNHLQTAVCRNDFVIKATVKGTRPEQTGFEAYNYDDDGLREYYIKVEKVFKLPQNQTKLPIKLSLKTGLGSAMCGVILKSGQTYLLGGYRMHNNDLHLEACSSIVSPWDSLEMTTRHLLHRGKYLRGCDCKIKTCNHESCLERSSKATNTCFYDVRVNSCLSEAGFCKRRGLSKNCRWIKGGEYRNCRISEKKKNQT